LNQTISKQCAELSKEKNIKGKHNLVGPWGCKAITCLSYKSNLCVLSYSTPNQRKKEIEKGKARISKAKFPTKIPPHKTLLIHDDCAYYDLMGNDLQSQFMTCLWYRIKMKHLPMLDFIHLKQFSPIWLDPVFLLMLF